MGEDGALSYKTYLPIVHMGGIGTVLHGVGATYRQCNYMPLVGAKWYYDWSTSPPACPGVENIGMLWGRDSVGLPIDSSTVLWFNEPENNQQSNMTPEVAAQLWNANIGMYVGKKNISPAVYTLSWLSRFLVLVSKKPDALAIHLYAWRTLSEEIQIAQNFFGQAVDLAQMHGINEIWLTEWAGLHGWMGMGPALEYERMMLKEILPTFPMITRQAWFQLSYHGTEEWAFGPDCNTSLVNMDTGQITEFGQVYIDAIGRPITDPRADVNEDGRIDIFDIVRVAFHFGEGESNT